MSRSPSGPCARQSQTSCLPGFRPAIPVPSSRRRQPAIGRRRTWYGYVRCGRQMAAYTCQRRTQPRCAIHTAACDKACARIAVGEHRLNRKTTRKEGEVSTGMRHARDMIVVHRGDTGDASPRGPQHTARIHGKTASSTSDRPGASASATTSSPVALAEGPTTGDPCPVAPPRGSWRDSAAAPVQRRGAPCADMKNLHHPKGA
jgi:hypothetical protein